MARCDRLYHPARFAVQSSLFIPVSFRTIHIGIDYVSWGQRTDNINAIKAHYDYEKILFILIGYFIS
jgi:hypothetical protein